MTAYRHLPRGRWWTIAARIVLIASVLGLLSLAQAQANVLSDLVVALDYLADYMEKQT